LQSAFPDFPLYFCLIRTNFYPMNQESRAWAVLLLLASGVAAMAGLTPEQLAKLPPPAAHPIDFAREVKPIFEASCIKCHGHGRSRGGFQIDSRETLLKGSDSGAVIIPGKSAESYLVQLVSALDPDNVMPQKGSKLTAEQVGILRAWIDQGVSWDKTVYFGRRPPINLRPPVAILPAGPEALTSINPVDLLLKPYFFQHRSAPKTPVSDRIFARRVYLDLLGLLPTPTQLEEFMADSRTDKREQLVRRSLADNERYAEHWLTFWNDLLRNDYTGTGYIDNGRKQITDWLYSALAKNMSFDRFVAQLVNPTPESEGFVKGIVWRGVVNASQTPPMQAAQNISQVFMGVNLKCASCHDSFINDWTLADAYGLASVYADGELEMVRCDKPTGQKAAMKFLYPELGSIDPKASKADRMKRLAEIITEQQNGRLSRTIVNRLWARFMGHGLVEPLDDMEQRAWNPELLDWLAADLIANRYDLKKTMERILTSEAYQMPSVPAGEQVAKEYVFDGPLVRRLSAEQFQDALSAVTGVWHAMPADTQADFAAGLANYPLAEVENPARLRWIWKDGSAPVKTAPGTIYFRRILDLPSQPTQASAVVACDNSFKLYVNGKEAGSGHDYTKPSVIDLEHQLHPGENLLAIAAVNDSAASGKDKEADPANPAGLICYVRIRQESSLAATPVLHIWDAGSDESWRWSTNKMEGWEKPEFSDQDWKPAVELGIMNMAPWKLEPKFARALSAAGLEGHVRASLVATDPLMTALGRPNREQVLTTRSSAATTLQALEMTNGKTFSEELRKGAETLLQSNPVPTRDLVIRLFERALARPPKPVELDMAQDLVGTPAKKEGLEDLLWAVAMLPEFQLIY
jgi:mono/diheme cytochrome c family protein